MNSIVIEPDCHQQQKQQLRSDIKKENEITKCQREYRNFANGKYSIKEDKNNIRNLFTNLDKMKKERELLNTVLTVALGKTHCVSYDRNMEKLENHVSLQENLEGEIKCLKRQTNDISTQLKRIEKQIESETKLALTDIQYKSNLALAKQTKINLENNLNNQRKHESILIADNRHLNACICHMIFERCLFNKLWQKMIKQLSHNKKILIDMVERAVLAFNQGADLCQKLYELRDERMRDEKLHMHEMIDIIRKLDNDSKMQKFLGVKGFRRELIKLEECEYKRRHQFKDEHNLKLNLYNDVLEDVKIHSNVDNIEQAMQLFEDTNNNYFSHFNYMNDLNNQMEFLNKSLKRLYIDIEHFREINFQTITNQEETLIGLQEKLTIEKNATIKFAENYAQDENELQLLFNIINEIFKILKCDDKHLKLLLGDYTKITKFNIFDYLPIIEKRLKTVIIYVYYIERQDEYSNQDDLTVRDIKKFKGEPTPIQDIVLVQQCSECAESGDVNRYDEEIVLPLAKDAIHEKAKAKTLAPTLQYRLHNLSKCKLPKSRALVNKRYQ